MKTLVITTFVALLLASPALAQSFNPTYGTGNVNDPNAAMRDVGGDVIMPTYPSLRSRPTLSQYLNGIHAEAPVVKRHGHTTWR